MGHSLFHAAKGAAAAAAAVDDVGRCPNQIVHREHYVHSHKKNIHQRQSPADTSAAVIEVTSTVSVEEVVEVNTQGSIFSTRFEPTPSLPAQTDATTSIEAPSSPTTPSPSTASTVTIDLSTSQPTSGLTSSPFSTATTTFATITTGSNSTSTSSTSSGSISSTTNFSTINSTSTSASSSSSISATSFISLSSISTTSSITSGSPTISSTSFISSIQSSLASSKTFSSISLSTFDSSSQSATGSSGGGVAGGIGATGTSTSTAASSTASSTAGASSTVAPPTSTVIASVFGGIAGLGVVLLVLLFLVRWHKRRLTGNQRALGGSSDGGARDSTTPVNPTVSPGMSQRMSERGRFAIPAGLANLTSYRPNRASRQTVSSTGGSEHGFVRVSGRKIRSVLESGGDGYGDPPDPNINVDGASFYQDSQGIYGEPASPASPGVGLRGSGIPNFRPSPARTPVIEQGAFLEHDLDQPPSRPDGGGRSRSGSNTGSHVSVSRFTEDV